MLPAPVKYALNNQQPPTRRVSQGGVETSTNSIHLTPSNPPGLPFLGGFMSGGSETRFAPSKLLDPTSRPSRVSCPTAEPPSGELFGVAGRVAALRDIQLRKPFKLSFQMRYALANALLQEIWFLLHRWKKRFCRDERGAPISGG